MPASRRASEHQTNPKTRKKECRKPRTTQVPSKVVIVKSTGANSANPYRELTPRQRWERIVRLYAEMLKRLEGQV